MKNRIKSIITRFNNCLKMGCCPRFNEYESNIIIEALTYYLNNYLKEED